MDGADVDARVKDILEALAAGKWGPQRLLEMAEEHGVSLSRAKEWQTQAFRVRRFLRGTDDEFRERILADLDFAADLARNLERTYTTKDGDERSYSAPDVNALIKARVEQAKLVRLDQPERADPDEPVPVEQLAAALRALGHEVKLNDRSEPASPSAAGERDTERPGKEREEGFLEGGEDE